MGKYHENEGVRFEIDRLLQRNAKRQANLGMDSTYEERMMAVKLWKHDLEEIAKLDPEFVEILEPQNN